MDNITAALQGPRRQTKGAMLCYVTRQCCTALIFLPALPKAIHSHSGYKCAGYPEYNEQYAPIHHTPYIANHCDRSLTSDIAPDAAYSKLKLYDASQASDVLLSSCQIVRPS